MHPSSTAMKGLIGRSLDVLLFFVVPVLLFLETRSENASKGCEICLGRYTSDRLAHLRVSVNFATFKGPKQEDAPMHLCHSAVQQTSSAAFATLRFFSTNARPRPPCQLISTLPLIFLERNTKGPHRDGRNNSVQ